MSNKSMTKNKMKLLVLAILAGVIMVTAAVLIWYDYRIGGPEFRAAVQRCGADPVAGFTTKGRSNYITPTNDSYYPPSSMYDVYFCSIDEAQEAGYERWLYN